MEPPIFEVGDEDSCYIGVIPERHLYLAVFLRAYLDLFSKEHHIRESSLNWFKGYNAHITFLEVKEMFSLTPSRLNKLIKYMNKEDRNDKAPRRRCVPSS